jgi:hypothetical protein
MKITYSEYGVSPIQVISIDENMTYVIAEINRDHEERFKFELFNEKCRVKSSHKESYALGERHEFTVLKVHNQNIFVLADSNSINQKDAYAAVLKDQLKGTWLKNLTSKSLEKYLKEGNKLYVKSLHNKIKYDFDSQSRLELYSYLSKLICKDFYIEHEDLIFHSIWSCWIDINFIFINSLSDFLDSNLLVQKKDINDEKYYRFKNIEEPTVIGRDFMQVQKDAMEIIDLNGEEYIYCYTFQSHLDLAQLRNSSTYPIKIGKAKDDWLSRIQSQMGTANPEKAIILILIKCMSSSNIERGIHHFLKSKNKWISDAPGNEWFLSNIEEIKKITESLK